MTNWTPATAAKLISRRLAKAGLIVEIERSRQSDSRYIYIGGYVEAVSLRIAAHRNPAHNPMRVWRDGDRADDTVFEWRADGGRGFGPMRAEYPTWRALADAMIAYCATLERETD